MTAGTELIPAAAGLPRFPMAGFAAGDFGSPAPRCAASNGDSGPGGPVKAPLSRAL